MAPCIVHKLSDRWVEVDVKMPDPRGIRPFLRVTTGTTRAYICEDCGALVVHGREGV